MIVSSRGSPFHPTGAGWVWTCAGPVLHPSMPYRKIRRIRDAAGSREVKECHEGFTRYCGVSSTRLYTGSLYTWNDQQVEPMARPVFGPFHPEPTTFDLRVLVLVYQLIVQGGGCTRRKQLTNSSHEPPGRPFR